MGNWIHDFRVGLLLCALLLTSGCTSIELALGLRMRLDKVPVTGLTGMPGLSGQDGRSGWNGPGGAAGKIVVSVDPSAEPYLDRFVFSNKSGDGVPGAAPVARTVPVGALW